MWTELGGGSLKPRPLDKSHIPTFESYLPVCIKRLKMQFCNCNCPSMRWNTLMIPRIIPFISFVVIAFLLLYCIKSKYAIGDDLTPSYQITLQQNDSRLVEIVKRSYLIEPYSSNKSCELPMKTVWRSPISSIVIRKLGGKKNGFFIEAGELGSEWFSHSIQLEQLYDWKGLLIEHSKWRLRHLLNLNRKSYIAPVCLSPSQFAKVNSSILDVSTEDSPPEDIKSAILEKGFKIPCIPLFTLMLAVNQTEVDYMSLTLNGIEPAVLDSIPFQDANIKIISVNAQEWPNLIERVMITKGYVRVDSVERATFHHDIYLREEYISLRSK